MESLGCALVDLPLRLKKKQIEHGKYIFIEIEEVLNTLAKYQETPVR